jgi:hypothetical protein
MPMKRYKPEQIVTLLRQIEVGIANGKPTPQACKEAEITVTDEYLARVCRILRIPLPGRGYGAMKNAEKPTRKRPPLPPLPGEKE